MATPISRSDAIARVTLLSQPAEFPIVQPLVVEGLVDDARRPDSEGRLPDDDDYTPTYDLNAATASVFEVKAALVANRYDTNTDGQGLTRSQLVAQLQLMARMYRMRIAGVMRKDRPAPGAEQPAVEDFL